MAKVIKYTKTFKKQFKKRRQDPKWRSIFKSSLPQEFDDQKRSPWKYIIQCLIEDKTIPDYFYPHALEGVTMEKQETTRKKKRFDMKRSFRRISAVIATMAFTTGLAPAVPPIRLPHRRTKPLPPSLPPRAGRSSRPRIWAIPSISRAFRRRTPIRIPPEIGRASCRERV